MRRSMSSTTSSSSDVRSAQNKSLLRLKINQEKERVVNLTLAWFSTISRPGNG